MASNTALALKVNSRALAGQRLTNVRVGSVGNSLRCMIYYEADQLRLTGDTHGNGQITYKYHLLWALTAAITRQLGQLSR